MIIHCARRLLTEAASVIVLHFTVTRPTIPSKACGSHW